MRRASRASAPTIGFRLSFLVALLAISLPLPTTLATADVTRDPTQRYDGFVRVIDGDTFEINRRGARLGVGIIGIDAPMGNTRCGRKATAALWALTGNGVQLRKDDTIRFDRRERRMFYAYSAEGKSLALSLVRSGLARVTGSGDEIDLLRRAQRRARFDERGCLWGTDVPLDPKPLVAPAAPAPAGDIAPASMPTGFTREVVASGFTNPTSFTPLPDGRLLVAEQRGVIKVVNGGQVLAVPALDIRSRVNSYWDRGLLSVAADPNFSSNGFIYVLYTYENDATRFDGPKTARLTRFTMTGDVANPASETILLGTSVGSSCKNFPDGTNCIPSDSPSHTVGAIRFAADGTMFVTTGDGASFNLVDDDALRAQSLSSLGGKVLRITTTGSGVSDNPFFTGDPNANRSRVWAYGVRNAYRFSTRPGSSSLYLGDVGWGDWEEVNVVRRGDNLGWPCYEGSGRQLGYQPKSVCQTLYAAGAGAVRAPLHQYAHNNASAAVTGGAFYTGSSYPAAYQGAYFFGDYAKNVLSSLRTDGADNLTSAPSTFEDTAGGPVDIQMGPGGDLYYVSIVQGALVRVRYADTGPVTCAAGQYKAEYFSNRTLSGAPTTTRCEDAVSYDWGAGGPNAGVGTDNFSARWRATKNFTAGTYSFKARADDGIRLYIDGALVIDAWKDQAATEYTAERTLTGGDHEIVVEYYENAFDALAQVSWSAIGGGGPVTCGAEQFTAQHFANKTLSGTPTATTCTDTIQYDWGRGGPGTGVGTDNFSIRWRANKTFAEGNYRFTARADDGMRVYVDGTLLIDAWKDQAATESTAERTLAQGSHEVVVEYYENAWDAVASLTWAQIGGGGTGACTGEQFTAHHFANKTLSGTPVATTCDDAISYDWGRGGPGTGVGTDNFSIRWRANKTFAAGDYRFTARADDGIRVYVDGTLAIDAWKDQAASDFVVDRAMTEGTHEIVVEYYEGGFDAVARLSWVQTSTGGGGGPCGAEQFTADYFSNKTLSGTPTATRCDDAINYNWGAGGPTTGVGVDNFSVRWTANKTFSSGIHTFRTRSDDGVRLYVDGVRIIDSWRDQAAKQESVQYRLSAGVHQIVVEYYEGGFDALIEASWENTFPTEPGAPWVQITAPSANDLYSVGQTINFDGTATDDEEGDLSGRIDWTVEIDHCPGGSCHVHTLLTATGASGSFVAPDHGADSNMKVIARITDSDGKSSTSSVLIRPRLVDVQLSTSPGGMTVVLDGQSGSSPLVRKAVVGSRHTIFTPSPQGNRVFSSWSDGGAQQHDVTIGTSNVTYTARFAKA